jgi:hypothetical protein
MPTVLDSTCSAAAITGYLPAIVTSLASHLLAVTTQRNASLTSV